MTDKNQFLLSTLMDIKDKATRHERAVDEQKYLKSDLERITQIVERGMAILLNEQEEYTDYEIEQIHLNELKDGIEKLKTK